MSSHPPFHCPASVDATIAARGSTKRRRWQNHEIGQPIQPALPGSKPLEEHLGENYSDRKKQSKDCAAWYQLFSQFEGIAEVWLQRDNWALFREICRGNGDIDRYISDLSRPGALKASLNWYRANLAPRLPEPPPKLPPVEAPTLGIWSSNDYYLDGERMKMSGRFVKGTWRYEQIDDVSHFIPLDAPERLNQLLIEWLG